MGTRTSLSWPTRRAPMLQSRHLVPWARSPGYLSTLKSACQLCSPRQHPRPHPRQHPRQHPRRHPRRHPRPRPWWAESQSATSCACEFPPCRSFRNSTTDMRPRAAPPFSLAAARSQQPRHLPWRRLRKQVVPQSARSLRCARRRRMDFSILHRTPLPASRAVCRTHRKRYSFYTTVSSIRSLSHWTMDLRTSFSSPTGQRARLQ
jgi:hypothetical protein